jgi:hypothetical protein
LSVPLAVAAFANSNENPGGKQNREVVAKPSRRWPNSTKITAEPTMIQREIRSARKPRIGALIM